MQTPLNIKKECFESSIKENFDEADELTCPLYVCACVATRLRQMWSNRLDVIRRDGDDQSENGASSASASTLSSAACHSARGNLDNLRSALVVQLSVTTEERAKLFSGLMKILGRKLPAFPGLAQPSRGQLSFREFVKGVSGRGFVEAKKLVRLVKACRRGCPMPGERTGTGRVFANKQFEWQPVWSQPTSRTVTRALACRPFVLIRESRHHTQGKSIWRLRRR